MPEQLEIPLTRSSQLKNQHKFDVAGESLTREPPATAAMNFWEGGGDSADQEAAAGQGAVLPRGLGSLGC